MGIDPEYIQLTTLERLSVFGSLFAVSSVLGWLFFYKLGQLLLSLATPSDRDKGSYEFAVAVFCGAWAFPTVVMIAGLLGVFSVKFLIAFGLLVIGACLIRRIPLLPKPSVLMSFCRNHPLGMLGTVGGAFLFGWVASCLLQSWFDGGFSIAGGHLAKTGTYLPQFSDGQAGMVTLVAAVNVFFPWHTPLTAGLGWVPFYSPLLFLPLYFLFQELLGKKRWEPFALLIFIFPIAFKVPELRASITGFALVTWCFLFTWRALRDGRSSDLLGAIFALSAAWNFGQYGALYYFFFLGTLSIALWLGGRSDQALIPWKILFWTNALDWFHLIFTFKWGLGESASLAKVLLPGTASLLLARGMLWLIPRLPHISFKRRWLLLPFLLAVVLAYLENSYSDPRYNWVFFLKKTWFGELNFSSYGLLGYLFLVSLVISLPSAVRQVPHQGALALWAGFFVSCMFQFISARYVKAGTAPAGEPVISWDMWKDTTLYWINPFMVLGVAVLFDWISTTFGRFGRWITSRPFHAVAVTFALLMPLQNLAPYKVLFEKEEWKMKWHRFVTSQVAPHVDIQWMGQQLYSLPMYQKMGESGGFGGNPHRRQFCETCPIQAHWNHREDWSLLDYLSGIELKAGDSFLASDSVMTAEIYMNRQIRYRDGVNTLSPVYIGHHDLVTSYQSFWKRNMRIRRVPHNGMAYTVVNPAQNLVWVKTAQDTAGNLLGAFTVPRSGDYEIYHGEDWFPAEGRAFVNDRLIEPIKGSPSLGHVYLEAGATHLLRIAPPIGLKMNPEIPTVVYSRRYWDYELLILRLGATIGANSIMRSTGIPNAPVPIEDLLEIYSTQDPARRLMLLDRWKIKIIIVDKVIREYFPESDRILSADSNLSRRLIKETPVYVRSLN